MAELPAVLSPRVKQGFWICIPGAVGERSGEDTERRHFVKHSKASDVDIRVAREDLFDRRGLKAKGKHLSWF